MKKTLAALGASVLGLVGAVGAGAAPANASPASPLPAPCTDATQHLVNPDINPAADAWYMTCVPQYGMGKAEFSISAPEGGFPDGYSLTDGHQTVTSSPTAAQVQSYFSDFYAEDHGGAPAYTGAFINLTQDASGTTPTSQTYSADGFGEAPMSVAFPITSVSKVAELPAACYPDDGVSYQGQYVINYAPVTTTFSELVGSEVYKTTVTLTAPTLYLGLNFNPGTDSGFDEDNALCASSTAGTVFASSDNDVVDSVPLNTVPGASDAFKAADVPVGSEAWFYIANEIATNDPGILSTLLPATDGDTTVAGGAFTVTATPALAETGVDARPAGIIGGSLLLVGVGAFLFGRRRRLGIHRG